MSAATSSKVATRVDMVSKNPLAIVDMMIKDSAAFSSADIGRKLDKMITDPARRVSALKEVLESDRVIELGKNVNGDVMYSTPDHLKGELKLLEVTRDLDGRKGYHPVPTDEMQAGMDALVAEGRMSQEQRDGILDIANGPDICVLEAGPGTGKTTSLKFYVAAAKKAGYQVIGIAPTGKASAGLQDELKEAFGKKLGVPAYTIDSLQGKIDSRQVTIDDKTIVILDEVGMVDVRKVTPIIELLAKCKAKIIAVGDRDQLQPVAAGAALRLITEAIGGPTAKFTTYVRQRVPWMRDATKAFASLDAWSGMAAYADPPKGDVSRLNWVDTDEATLNATADHVVNRVIDSGRKDICLALAFNTVNVEGLNRSIREKLVERGVIGGDSEERYFSTIEGKVGFFPGDRLMFKANNYSSALNVRNGSLGTVVGFIGDRGLLVLVDGAEKPVVVDPAVYRAVAHGWASSVHASQGTTVPDAVCLLCKTEDGKFGQDSQATNVMGTRHKDNLTFIASEQSFPGGFVELMKSLERDGLKGNAVDYQADRQSAEQRAAWDRVKLYKQLDKEIEDSGRNNVRRDGKIIPVDAKAIAKAVEDRAAVAKEILAAYADHRLALVDSSIYNYKTKLHQHADINRPVPKNDVVRDMDEATHERTASDLKAAISDFKAAHRGLLSGQGNPEDVMERRRKLTAMAHAAVNVGEVMRPYINKTVGSWEQVRIYGDEYEQQLSWDPMGQSSVAAQASVAKYVAMREAERNELGRVEIEANQAKTKAKNMATFDHVLERREEKWAQAAEMAKDIRGHADALDQAGIKIEDIEVEARNHANLAKLRDYSDMAADASDEASRTKVKSTAAEILANYHAHADAVDHLKMSKIDLMRAAGVSARGPKVAGQAQASQESAPQVKVSEAQRQAEEVVRSFVKAAAAAAKVGISEVERDVAAKAAAEAEVVAYDALSKLSRTEILAARATTGLLLDGHKLDDAKRRAGIDPDADEATPEEVARKAHREQMVFAPSPKVDAEIWLSNPAIRDLAVEALNDVGRGLKVSGGVSKSRKLQSEVYEMLLGDEAKQQGAGGQKVPPLPKDSIDPAFVEQDLGLDQLGWKSFRRSGRGSYNRDGSSYSLNLTLPDGDRPAMYDRHLGELTKQLAKIQTAGEMEVRVAYFDNWVPPGVLRRRLARVQDNVVIRFADPAVAEQVRQTVIDSGMPTVDRSIRGQHDFGLDVGGKTDTESLAAMVAEHLRTNAAIREPLVALQGMLSQTTDSFAREAIIADAAKLVAEAVAAATNERRAVIEQDLGIPAWEAYQSQSQGQSQASQAHGQGETQDQAQSQDQDQSKAQAQDKAQDQAQGAEQAQGQAQPQDAKAQSQDSSVADGQAKTADGKPLLDDAFDASVQDRGANGAAAAGGAGGGNAASGNTSAANSADDPNRPLDDTKIEAIMPDALTAKLTAKLEDRIPKTLLQAALTHNGNRFPVRFGRDAAISRDVRRSMDRAAQLTVDVNSYFGDARKSLQHEMEMGRVGRAALGAFNDLANNIETEMQKEVMVGKERLEDWIARNPKAFEVTHELGLTDLDPGTLMAEFFAGAINFAKSSIQGKDVNGIVDAHIEQVNHAIAKRMAEYERTKKEDAARVRLAKKMGLELDVFGNIQDPRIAAMDAEREADRLKAAQAPAMGGDAVDDAAAAPKADPNQAAEATSKTETPSSATGDAAPKQDAPSIQIQATELNNQARREMVAVFAAALRDVDVNGAARDTATQQGKQPGAAEEAAYRTVAADLANKRAAATAYAILQDPEATKAARLSGVSMSRLEAMATDHAARLITESSPSNRLRAQGQLAGAVATLNALDAHLATDRGAASRDIEALLAQKADLEAQIRAIYVGQIQAALDNNDAPALEALVGQLGEGYAAAYRADPLNADGDTANVTPAAVAQWIVDRADDGAIDVDPATAKGPYVSSADEATRAVLTDGVRRGLASASIDRLESSVTNMLHAVDGVSPAIAAMEAYKASDRRLAEMESLKKGVSGVVGRYAELQAHVEAYKTQALAHAVIALAERGDRDAVALINSLGNDGVTMLQRHAEVFSASTDSASRDVVMGPDERLVSGYSSARNIKASLDALIAAGEADLQRVGLTKDEALTLAYGAEMQMGRRAQAILLSPNAMTVFVRDWGGQVGADKLPAEIEGLRAAAEAAVKSWAKESLGAQVGFSDGSQGLEAGLKGVDPATRWRREISTLIETGASAYEFAGDVATVAADGKAHIPMSVYLGARRDEHQAEVTHQLAMARANMTPEQLQVVDAALDFAKATRDLKLQFALGADVQPARDAQFVSETDLTWQLATMSRQDAAAIIEMTEISIDPDKLRAAREQVDITRAQGAVLAAMESIGGEGEADATTEAHRALAGVSDSAIKEIAEVTGFVVDAAQLAAARAEVAAQANADVAGQSPDDQAKSINPDELAFAVSDDQRAAIDAIKAKFAAEAALNADRQQNGYGSKDEQDLMVNAAKADSAAYEVMAKLDPLGLEAVVEATKIQPNEEQLEVARLVAAKPTVEAGVADDQSKTQGKAQAAAAQDNDKDHIQTTGPKQSEGSNKVAEFRRKMAFESVVLSRMGSVEVHGSASALGKIEKHFTLKPDVSWAKKDYKESNAAVKAYAKEYGLNLNEVKTEINLAMVSRFDKLAKDLDMGVKLSRNDEYYVKGASLDAGMSWALKTADKQESMTESNVSRAKLSNQVRQEMHKPRADTIQRMSYQVAGALETLKQERNDGFPVADKGSYKLSPEQDAALKEALGSKLFRDHLTKQVESGDKQAAETYQALQKFGGGFAMAGTSEAAGDRVRGARI